MRKIVFIVSFYLMPNIIFSMQFAPSVFAETATDEKQTDIAEGKRIYSVSCILCHGSKGKGDGPASVFIGPYSHPRPNNFTIGSFKFRSTESGELPTLKDLMRTIRYGIPGYMPSFKHLDEDGIRQVARYVADTFIEDELRLESDTLPIPLPVQDEQVKEEAIHSSPEADIFEEEMSRTSGTDPISSYSNQEIITVLNDLSRGPASASHLAYQPGQIAGNYANLVHILKQISENSAMNADRIEQLEHVKKPALPSEPSAKRGRDIFHEMQCIACHGVNGKGHEVKTNMKDEQNLPVMAADLTQPSSFGNGNTRKDIFRTVMTGLNGTPMPSFSDLFIGEEDRAWDLIEYVYSLQEDPLARFLP